jgi:hypothetical protein
MELFIPTWLDLAGWAGVAVASLGFIGFGRLMLRGRASPEGALVAGWGAAALALTLWGVTTPASLRFPAIALAFAALAGLLLPHSRLRLAEWRSVGRLVVLALPLLLVMASARPSLPDTFLNLLPNAAYLYDHAAFPADARPPAHSFLPGAPYNMQLVAFLAGLVTPAFPPNAMIGFNLALLLAIALLLARLIAGGEDDPQTVPPWTCVALGLLLVTALNPGFVPRYHVSDYSEPSVTVTLAFAGWAAARLLSGIAEGKKDAGALGLFALSLAALVDIKQDSVALVAGSGATAALLALLAPTRRARQTSLARLVLAATPAIVLYVAWRWYVLSHFAEGELKPLPFAEWQFHALPQILGRMLQVMRDKAFLFLSFAVVAIVAWRRGGPLDVAGRVAALLAGVFILYNAALVVAYVGHFPGTIGTDAHSYYRYNTHLALLLMVGAVMLARPCLVARSGATAVPAWRWVGATGVVLILLLPVVLWRTLRFDLEVPQRRAWQMAAAAAPALHDDERVALILPGDNGSLAPMLEGLLRAEPPRRPDIEVKPIDRLAVDTLATLDREGFQAAIVSCLVPSSATPLSGLPTGSPRDGGALLRRDADGWHAVATWSYPPVAPGARWSLVLSPAPLCL